MGKKTEFDEEASTAESEYGLYFREANGRFAALEQIKGPGAPQVFPLARRFAVVGRARDADIQVDSLEVSRKHMTIKRIGAESVCEDQGSRNGIYLNGVKVHSATLRDGDTLQLGNVVFLYQEGNR
jgi:pSer/pThr/pTyr-binding forkhead associated (FHA) protein